MWVEAAGAATRSQRPQPFLEDPCAGCPLVPLSVLLGKCHLLSLLICLQNKRVVSFSMLGESGCNEGFWRGEQQGRGGWFPPILSNPSAWLLSCAMTMRSTSNLPTGACTGEGGSAAVYGEQWCCRVLVSPGVYWSFPIQPLLHNRFFQCEMWRSDGTGRQVGLQDDVIRAKHKLGLSRGAGALSSHASGWRGG